MGIPDYLCYAQVLGFYKPFFSSYLSPQISRGGEDKGQEDWKIS